MPITGGPGWTKKYREGAPVITFTTAAAVTAGRVVEITSAGTVQHAGATSRKAIGTVLQTASAAGDRVPVHLFADPVELVASGAITAGDEVVAASDGSGKVSTLAAAVAATAGDINNARSIIGIALEAIANGADGLVLVTGA